MPAQVLIYFELSDCYA